MARLSFRRALGWRSSPIVIGAAVAIGQFSDLFLFGMRIPLLPFLLRNNLGVPEEEVQGRIATLLASFSLASLIFAIPAGYVADFPRLRGPLYLVGLLALAGATITFYTSHKYAILIVTGALNGFSVAVLYAAGWSMVADAVAPENIGKALGTIRSFVSVGELAGPPVGGLIFSHWGFVGILATSLIVLALDFIMRLLMVDRPRMQRVPEADNSGDDEEETGKASETDRLLPHRTTVASSSAASATIATPSTPRQDDNDSVTLAGSSTTRGSGKKPHKKPFFLPIIFCLSDPQLVVSMLLFYVQFIIFGTYDATLTLEIIHEFHFTPEKVGAMYLALVVPRLLLGPVAGWAVDRFGPRRIAVAGYGIFVPALVAMLLPAEGYVSSAAGTGSPAFAIFCTSLAVQGVCVGLVMTPAMVKSKQAVETAMLRHPDRFGNRSALGQMFGLNTLIASLGLMTGNYTGASIRAAAGYGILNLVLAGLCAVSAALAWAVFQVDGNGNPHY
ncbi:major facilitator superfamily domain-containing protein [Podospora didyma]|uniref:Major facilitator superfamily domain-containing protein n=1 Tax=Podospora didyma TaxID=330526 RepID=A0AAE0U7Q6_9PEZI|nr:major facilitator superfamily domain-containing protein [Podospora didyma]